MNIISFLGSPREKGNTAVLLNKVLDGIDSKFGEKGEKVYLHGSNIKPCMGCNACKTNEDAKCVIDDDMQEIYKKIEKADLIIVASPIYWWGVTAQTKLFVDRTYGLNYKNRNANYRNKKLMLLMTYGGELPNSGPETVENNFNEICSYLKLINAGVFGVCTDKVKLIENKEALEEAYKFGQGITKYFNR